MHYGNEFQFYYKDNWKSWGNFDRNDKIKGVARVGEGKDRSKETSEKAVAVVNVRDGSAWNWKWRESRKILVKVVE